MNVRQVRTEIDGLALLGVGRSAIFARLRGRGMKDSRLAWLVASHVDGRRRAENRWHVRIVVAIVLVQAAADFLDAFGLGQAVGPGLGWVAGAASLAFGLMFAWGFHRDRAGAYNAYILMALVQLPLQLDDFSASAAGMLTGLLVGLVLPGYVWWVRTRVFPDFYFLSPRKSAGQYVFSD